MVPWVKENLSPQPVLKEPAFSPTDSPTDWHLRKPSATEIFHSQFGAQVRSPAQGRLSGEVHMYMNVYDCI